MTPNRAPRGGVILRFDDLLPGDRVLLPLRDDQPHEGPYLIRSAWELHGGTWEVQYAHVSGVVTRRFPPDAAERGALHAPDLKDIA